MPRTSLVSDEVILDTLKDFNIFKSDGTLKTEIDGVWKKFQEALASKKHDINIHNLYMKFKRKDGKLLKQVKSNFQLPATQNSKKTTNIKKTKISNEVVQDSEEYDQQNLTQQQNNAKRSDDFDDLISLHSMKDDIKYNSLIREFSPRWFQFIFWSPEQICIWKKLVVKNNAAATLFVLDDVVENFQTKNYASKSVLLFVLAVNTCELTIPLAQGMTEKPDIAFILKFTKKLLKKVEQPSEIVTGFSLPLLNGLSIAFNDCSLDEYLSTCYKHLLNVSASALPNTILRVDIITLLKMMDGLECFQGQLKQVKNFYFGCIIYLSTIQSLNEMKEFVLSMFIVMLCTCENDLVDSKRNNLIQDINSTKIKATYTKFKENNSANNADKYFAYLKLPSNEFFHLQNENNSEIKSFFKLINLEASYKINESVQSSTPSAYCIPPLLSSILEILYIFPVWTSVIRKYEENLYTVSNFEQIDKIIAM